MAAAALPMLLAPLEDVMVGDLEDVRYANGQLHTVRVLALDTISQPPRARVCRCDNHEIMVVQMVEMSKPFEADAPMPSVERPETTPSMPSPVAAFSWHGFSRLAWRVASKVTTLLEETTRRGQTRGHLEKTTPDLSTGKLSSLDPAPLEPGVHGETTMAPLVRRVAATLRNSWSAVQRWVQRGAVDDDAEVANHLGFCPPSLCNATTSPESRAWQYLELLGHRSNETMEAAIAARPDMAVFAPSWFDHTNELERNVAGHGLGIHGRSFAETWMQNVDLWQVSLDTR
eukprot:symbB.v1.2.035814.t1/scaffold4908.1/size33077/2